MLNRVGSILVCETCKKDFDKDYRKCKYEELPRFCSRSCANNKGHSEERNKKISEGVKKHTSTPGYIHWNKQHNSSFCLNCNEEISWTKKSGYCNKCYKQSDDYTKYRENMSEKRSKAIERLGSGGFLDIKYFKIQNLEGIEFNVRGTWELKYAEYLNSIGVLWNRNITFKYKRPNDNVNRTYLPDFFLPETNEYIEIKGFLSEKDKEKMKCVEEQNKVKIKMIFGPDLKDLGIKLK